MLPLPSTSGATGELVARSCVARCSLNAPFISVLCEGPRKANEMEIAHTLDGLIAFRSVSPSEEHAATVADHARQLGFAVSTDALVVRATAPARKYIRTFDTGLHGVLHRAADLSVLGVYEDESVRGKNGTQQYVYEPAKLRQIVASELVDWPRDHCPDGFMLVLDDRLGSIEVKFNGLPRLSLGAAELAFLREVGVTSIPFYFCRSRIGDVQVAVGMAEE